MEAKKLWRTLVRVQDASSDKIRLVVPGWNSNEVVELPIDAAPSGLKTGQRLHARVNIGAESADDLFFCGWELTENE